MTLLAKDALLGAAPPQETLHIPQLGGDLIVRGLTAVERDAFEHDVLTTHMVNIRARLVALAVRDQDGARMYSAADIEALGKSRADVVDLVFAVAQRLTGISDKDEAALTRRAR